MNIRKNKNNNRNNGNINTVVTTSVYTVKRSRGRSSWIVVSPHDWEEDRRFTDLLAAKWHADKKNCALEKEHKRHVKA